MQPSPFVSTVQIEDRQAARISPSNAAFSWDTFKDFSQKRLILTCANACGEALFKRETILNTKIFGRALKTLAKIEVLNILEKDEGSWKPKSIELYQFFRRSKNHSAYV